MYRKLHSQFLHTLLLVIGLSVTISALTCFAMRNSVIVEAPELEEESIIIEAIEIVSENPLDKTMIADEIEEEYEESKATLPIEDIELIALVTMAEAEGECEEGKRLVIDTILNRVDSGSFPDTIYEVVYQKNQFSSMWNGRIDRCYVSEEICKLVEEEYYERQNYDVLYFTAENYGKYGTPLFNVGNHYFSGV